MSGELTSPGSFLKLFSHLEFLLFCFSQPILSTACIMFFSGCNHWRGDNPLLTHGKMCLEILHFYHYSGSSFCWVPLARTQNLRVLSSCARYYLLIQQCHKEFGMLKTAAVPVSVTWRFHLSVLHLHYIKNPATSHLFWWKITGFSFLLRRSSFQRHFFSGLPHDCLFVFKPAPRSAPVPPLTPFASLSRFGRYR